MTREQIERTVRGLKACAACPEWYDDCAAQDCPYIDSSLPGDASCTNELARDALELVKQMARDVGINGGVFATRESRERMKMTQLIIRSVTARPAPEKGEK